MPSINLHNKKSLLLLLGAGGILIIAAAVFLIVGNAAYNNEVLDIYNRAKQIEEQQNKAKLDSIKQGLEQEYIAYGQYPANLEVAGLDSGFDPAVMEYRLLSKDKYILRMLLSDGSYYDLSN
ncbi:MAG TPA: hypothetical protein VJC17_03845 [Candidatus Dojkabacteria bacterium]|nr:hypothetical protein [Candidatus Dojkabacteria bacterium]